MMHKHLNLESLSKCAVAILVLLSSSALGIHILSKQEFDTIPMVTPHSIMSFCVYVAILFQHPDPLAIIFALCITEQLGTLTGLLTAIPAPVCVISNVGRSVSSNTGN